MHSDKKAENGFQDMIITIRITRRLFQRKHKLLNMADVSVAGDNPVSFQLPSIDQLKQNSLVLHSQDNQSDSEPYNEADILVVIRRCACVRARTCVHVCVLPAACVDLTVFSGEE